MLITALKTHPITVGESLLTILEQYVPPLKEQAILCITSKIISLCEGRVVAKNTVDNKYDLIRREADAFLPEEESSCKTHLTIKNNILIPSAGIDESNGDGLYILYPEHIQQTLGTVWDYLRTKHSLEHVGVIMTDSHTTPLRRGVTGIALGWCGFEPSYSYIGQPDIFGHPLRITKVNVPDALAAAAVFEMGEGAEQTPLALIENPSRIRFLSHLPDPDNQHLMHISLEEDIYAPLLQNANWIWNRKGQKVVGHT